MLISAEEWLRRWRSSGLSQAECIRAIQANALEHGAELLERANSLKLASYTQCASVIVAEAARLEATGVVPRAGVVPPVTKEQA